MEEYISCFVPPTTSYCLGDQPGRPTWNPEREWGVGLPEERGADPEQSRNGDSYIEVMSLRAWSSSSLMALYFSFWA